MAAKLYFFLPFLCSTITSTFQGQNMELLSCRDTSIEARPFKVPFYKASHSKGIKERALHVHQRKTKHFIAKLLAQPYRLLHTFSILVGQAHVNISRYRKPQILGRNIVIYSCISNLTLTVIVILHQNVKKNLRSYLGYIFKSYLPFNGKNK